MKNFHWDRKRDYFRKRDYNRNHNRNVALILIGVGILLLVNNHWGFFTVLSLVLIIVGINKIRSASPRKGYILIGIGAVILIGGNLSLLIAVILISLGFFYIRSKQLQGSESYVKKSLIESIKWGREPWVLRSTSIWNVIGELHMDLTYAILEQKEITLVLQGVIADVDIIVPEDIGLSVVSTVLAGESDVGPNKESGILNKTVWQSENYETADNQVKIMISYIIGDIDIKVV
ncbi:cell wall-active antibiotics response protein LiaF [Paenibacillus piri]|uniref:Cell wall-active antibiotics response LiaF-like C-terminal domain-containing protein n=1 Tax=Paenibacillus piri TaxID=2547395 RepID=A0A4V2ZS93_9BACL|nr:cell wall-active antibiotics response protein LiaF [Paenibacillus piri]TDF91854.1 hypothetical protein E1757_31430 [Paenibacillus piri]